MKLVWSQQGQRSCALVRQLVQGVAVTLAACIPCSAQSDTTTRIPPHLCWRGKPAPDCSTFWITEFGVDAVASSTQTVVSENFGGGNVYRWPYRIPR